MLAINSETVDSTRLGRDVLLMPATEFLDDIADKSVVKVLTKVGMACNDLVYKDTPFNGQDGNIAVSSIQVEDEDITSASDLLVEAPKGD